MVRLEMRFYDDFGFMSLEMSFRRGSNAQTHWIRVDSIVDRYDFSDLP